MRSTPQTQWAVRGRYDAAQTVNENVRHWANADGLSANAANSPQVRRVLRNRSRYEVANNSYARGIVLTLANDVIGTGPRLQLLTDNERLNTEVERAFMTWARKVNLAAKLRTLHMARVQDGEGFAVLTTNPRLDSPVQLDLRLVEADQVATPGWMPNAAQPVDGIVLDAAGNPVEYHILRSHPGDTLAVAGQDAYDRVPANTVLHWFRVDRPGQLRGIPDITPALPLFAQLRRYTLAVLAAAETAADYAAVVYTDAPPGGEAEDYSQLPPEIQLENRLLTVLPGGWKLTQLKAEQPVTGYAEFKDAILNEIGRCLNMPSNITAGNSAGYNYASGRLDHQIYYRSVRIEQQHLATTILDRILAAWLDEAALVPGLLPDADTPYGNWEHKWFFDGSEHVDPLKEAAAQGERLSNHTTTLADEYARLGLDWETQLRQRAREVKLMRELGLDPNSDGIIVDSVDEDDEDDDYGESDF